MEKNKINFKSFGEGDPVIIMHGLLGMLDNWHSFAKKLAKDYLVYIVDLRNHGKSFHSDEMNYKLMADDILGFMEKNGIPKATLLGHSMGGKVGMQFALDQPSMVSNLIVVDMAPIAYSGGHQEILDALLSVDIDNAEERADVENHLMSRIQSKPIVWFLMKNLSRKKEGGFKWKANLESLNRNYREILQEISGQSPYEGDSLFIKGENSDYLNDRALPLIRELFPNFQRVEIEGAGHWVHADAPKATLKAVKQFLASHPPV